MIDLTYTQLVCFFLVTFYGGFGLGVFLIGLLGANKLQEAPYKLEPVDTFPVDNQEPDKTSKYLLEGK